MCAQAHTCSSNTTAEQQGMTTTTHWLSRLNAAWQALRGAPPPDPADPRSRIAALELDLRERDVELKRVRGGEYERLAKQTERDRAGRRRPASAR